MNKTELANLRPSRRDIRRSIKRHNPRRFSELFLTEKITIVASNEAWEILPLYSRLSSGAHRQEDTVADIVF